MDECRKHFNEWAKIMGKESLMLTAFSAWQAAWDARSNSWQLIETAPMDGSQFLAFEKSRRPFIALWLDADHPDIDEAGWYEHWSFDPVDPTHWQPLPDDPK